MRDVAVTVPASCYSTDRSGTHATWGTALVTYEIVSPRADNRTPAASYIPSPHLMYDCFKPALSTLIQPYLATHQKENLPVSYQEIGAGLVAIYKPDCSNGINAKYILIWTDFMDCVFSTSFFLVPKQYFNLHQSYPFDNHFPCRNLKDKDPSLIYYRWSSVSRPWELYWLTAALPKRWYFLEEHFILRNSGA